MKSKILFLLLWTGFIFVSCQKDNKHGLDPNAKISVTGVHSQSRADVADVPAGGIAGTGITDSLEFITKYAFDYGSTTSDGSTPLGGYGLDEDTYYLLRDLENNKLKFWGVGVVSNGFLGPYVTDETDFVVRVAEWPDGKAIMPLGFKPTAEEFAKVIFDTVAYIPNSVVLEARAKITAAFNAGDYDACYKLFDEAYVFLPTTGPKWRAMKQAGIE